MEIEGECVIHMMEGAEGMRNLFKIRIDIP